MSIQTELTRIINAKAAIKAAIEGKGVTVPAGTLLDGMAALIETIEAGGGGRAFASGSFTLSSNLSSSYIITHNLGEIPYFFLVFCKSTNSFFDSPPYAVFALFGFSQSIGEYNNFAIQGRSLGAFSDLITCTSSKRPLHNATSTTISTRKTGYTFVGGNEYHWIAIGA